MKTLFILIISLILLSCNQSTKNQKESINIDCIINFSNSIFNLDKLHFDIKNAIALETKEECIIGDINKILFNDSTVVVLDSRKSKSVFMFTDKGRYKNKIHNVGKAEGEYINIRDFIVGFNNEKYYLYDKRLGKILQFDNNWHFVEERKVKQRINSFQSIPNEKFIVERSSDGEYYIEIWNNEFKVSKKLLKRPKYLYHYDISTVFPLKKNLNNGTISYYPSFSNKIYKLQNNDFKVYGLIEGMKLFADKLFFEKNTGKHPGLIVKELIKFNYVTFLDYIENSDMILLKYNKGSKRIVSIYDKNTQLTTSYELINDCFSNLLFNTITVNEQDEFVSYIFPYQLSQTGKCKKLFSKYGRNQDKEYDNPIIVSFKIVL